MVSFMFHLLYFWGRYTLYQLGGPWSLSSCFGDERNVFLPLEVESHFLDFQLIPKSLYQPYYPSSILKGYLYENSVSTSHQPIMWWASIIFMCCYTPSFNSHFFMFNAHQALISSICCHPGVLCCIVCSMLFLQPWLIHHWQLDESVLVFGFITTCGCSVENIKLTLFVVT